MQSLQAALAQAGIKNIIPEFTGQWIRAGESEDDKPEAFIGYEKNGRKIAYFKHWRTGAQGTWVDGAGSVSGLSDEEKSMLEQAKQDALRAEKERQEKISEASQREWGSLPIPAPGIELHPYLVKKGLSEWFGARVDSKGNLVIPLQDPEQLKIWSLQRITPNGEKRFYGRKKGCYFGIGREAILVKRLFICEGFATGASIYSAINPDEDVVACALDAGNIKPVAVKLRSRLPDAQIIICADNDESGVGQAKAQEACQEVGNASWVMPDKAGQDFNDVMCEAGLDAVREILSGARGAGTKESYADSFEEGAIGPVAPPNKNVEKKKRGISEKRIADALLEYFGKDILRQDKSLFRYDGKRWRELTLADEDAIKNRINAICKDGLESKHVNSAFKTFVRYVPSVPEGINLFNPNPVAANFENGTLHLRQTSDHEYYLEFSDHRREDYLINLLPYKYDGSGSAKNQEFLDMLERIFQGDSDKDEKIRAIRQMYGACLVSAWPHFFMLYGKPKTGKSTIIQIAEHLVSRENRCSVEPHEFHSFNMESMVGKLLNADPDIETQKPITESQIKKVIDRREFRIKRKGIADAYGYIPGTHIFGGNDIPPTAAGYQKAHDRRWTFIEFKNEQGVGKYDKEFWLWVWEKSPEGIINFAIEGLKDLCQERGHYVNPASGIEKMRQWQGTSDALEHFFDDIGRGEILDYTDDGKEDFNNVLAVDENGQIERPKLWNLYSKWALSVYGRLAKLERTIVFDRLRERGFSDKKTAKERYFQGLCIKPRKDAGF